MLVHVGPTLDWTAFIIVFGVLILCDGVWLTYVVSGKKFSQLYRGYKQVVSFIPKEKSSNSQFKLAMVVIHAIAAGMLRGSLSFGSYEDALFAGMFIGFYAYVTFNVTIAAIHSEWGLWDAIPDVLYGTGVWTLASYLAYQVTS